MIEDITQIAKLQNIDRKNYPYKLDNHFFLTAKESIQKNPKIQEKENYITKMDESKEKQEEKQTLDSIINFLALQTQQREEAKQQVESLDPTTPEYAKAVETYTTNHEAALRSYDAMGITPPFPREISIMRPTIDAQT
jgi:hypothetical protein